MYHRLEELAAHGVKVNCEVLVLIDLADTGNIIASNNAQPARHLLHWGVRTVDALVGHVQNEVNRLIEPLQQPNDVPTITCDHADHL